jgi:hypothetical protein
MGNADKLPPGPTWSLLIFGEESTGRELDEGEEEPLIPDLWMMHRYLQEMLAWKRSRRPRAIQY